LPTGIRAKTLLSPRRLPVYAAAVETIRYLPASARFTRAGDQLGWQVQAYHFGYSG